MASLNDVASGALAQIRNDLLQFELEPSLQSSVREHYRHLETLAASLKRLGIDGKAIDHHVMQIFEKYRIELLRNLERLDQQA